MTNGNKLDYTLFSLELLMITSARLGMAHEGTSTHDRLSTPTRRPPHSSFGSDCSSSSALSNQVPSGRT